VPQWQKNLEKDGTLHTGYSIAILEHVICMVYKILFLFVVIL